MKLNNLSAASVLFFAIPSALATVASYCPPYGASPWEQEKLFNEFVVDFYVDNNITKAFTTYVSEGYIQHNPFIPDGRDAVIAILGSFPPPVVPTVIVHQLFQNNIGVVHHKDITPGQPITAVADFYRYNGSCIVEHWDVIQSVPANATNPHPLF